jgi:hypothetical protein
MGWLDLSLELLTDRRAVRWVRLATCSIHRCSMEVGQQRYDSISHLVATVCLDGVNLHML